MRPKALKHKYSGDAKPASKQELKQRANKAFVCRFFGVRANTPSDVLKEAIKRITGANMSFGNSSIYKLKRKTRLMAKKVDKCSYLLYKQTTYAENSDLH